MASLVDISFVVNCVLSIDRIHGTETTVVGSGKQLVTGEMEVSHNNVWGIMSDMQLS